MRQWRVEYESDQHDVSRALKALDLTDVRCEATPGTNGVGGPKASEISELRRTAKWREPPEGLKGEDELVTGEELKLFQSVAVQFNILAMDRVDLLYSGRELMRKMASRADLAALQRIARFTINNLRMAGRYPQTGLDRNILECLAVQT